MSRFLWICIGGAVGTGARYLISVAAGRVLGAAFPYGTLLVNLLGCFVIALLMRIATTTELLSPSLRLTLTTGFLGGLTTYSTFNYETTRLLQDRAVSAAIANFAATTLGCFAAGLLGFVLADRIIR